VLLWVTVATPDVVCGDAANPSPRGRLGSRLAARNTSTDQRGSKGQCGVAIILRERPRFKEAWSSGKSIGAQEELDGLGASGPAFSL
jgi:hypothetical protein